MKRYTPLAFLLVALFLTGCGPKSSPRHSTVWIGGFGGLQVFDSDHPETMISVPGVGNVQHMVYWEQTYSAGRLVGLDASCGNCSKLFFDGPDGRDLKVLDLQSTPALPASSVRTIDLGHQVVGEIATGDIAGLNDFAGGYIFVSIPSQSSILVIDPIKEKVINTIQLPPNTQVYAMAALLDGGYASAYGKIFTFDIHNSTPTATIDLGNSLTSLAIGGMNSDLLIATAFDAGKVYVLNATPGTNLSIANEFDLPGAANIAPFRLADIAFVVGKTSVYKVTLRGDDAGTQLYDVPVGPCPFALRKLSFSRFSFAPPLLVINNCADTLYDSSGNYPTVKGPAVLVEQPSPAIDTQATQTK